MTDMLDAILEAKAAGATPEQLAPIFELQKKAMWRLDFISSENSDGFHADQEAVVFWASRSITAARHRPPHCDFGPAPSADKPAGKPVEGVTPTDKASLDAKSGEKTTEGDPK